MEEKEHIILLKNGNILSYEVIFRRYYPSFLAFVKGLVKKDFLAEDITQNVFMKVWLHRENLREDMNFRNYLFVIAKHEIYNHFRLKSTINNIRLTQKDDFITREEITSHYDIQQIKDVLYKAVSSMPAQRQKIFKLSREGYLSNLEIAEMLGISIRTVEKHIELALKEIRKVLPPFQFLLFLLFT